jgi:hypothetical protein
MRRRPEQFELRLGGEAAREFGRHVVGCFRIRSPYAEAVVFAAFAAFAGSRLPAFAFRRPAQYFAMRSLTALRCAAVMVRRPARFRPGGDAAAGRSEVSPATARPPRSSGNVRRRVATSAPSVSSRAWAPTRAYCCMSERALAIR